MSYTFSAKFSSGTTYNFDLYASPTYDSSDVQLFASVFWQTDDSEQRSWRTSFRGCEAGTACGRVVEEVTQGHGTAQDVSLVASAVYSVVKSARSHFSSSLGT